jgi:hypothetical protein
LKRISVLPETRGKGTGIVTAQRYALIFLSMEAIQLVNRTTGAAMLSVMTLTQDGLPLASERSIAPAKSSASVGLPQLLGCKRQEGIFASVL